MVLPVRVRASVRYREPALCRMHARQPDRRSIVLAATLMSALVFATACESHSRTFSMETTAAAAAAIKQKGQPLRAVDPGAGLHGRAAIGSTMDVTVTGDVVQFVLHITNNSAKKLELTFPTGETHDVAVVDAAGGEVWRWSSGQMFTQALRNQPLDSHASRTYTVRWRAPHAHGSLTAIATLMSSNYPLEMRAPFSLP